jgi:aerobic carbon-monoxide dehydrogenase medium subunit
LIVMRQGLVASEYVLDLKGLDEMNYITFDDKKGLAIGATTTHRTIEKSELLAKKYPVLCEMEEKLASIQTRNWGTIGGNLAHADAAGDPAPVLISLEAKVKLASAKGDRVMDLEAFYTDLFETAMNPDEIITEVQVPVLPPKTGAAYQKFNLLENDQGIVAVAARITLDDKGSCKEARIVLGNAGVTPIRAKSAEALLVGKKLSDALLVEIATATAADADPVSDIHASEEYRRHLVGVLAKRMVTQAWARAEKGR